MFGIANAANSTSRSRSKRSTALMRPIEPTCTRSSRRSPRFAYGRAIDTTNGMYASIRRSRAERSPSSRYARSNSADELHERANRSAATIVISLVATVDISKCIFKSRGCTQRTLGTCFFDGLVFTRENWWEEGNIREGQREAGEGSPCCSLLRSPRLPLLRLRVRTRTSRRARHRRCGSIDRQPLSLPMSMRQRCPT